MSNVISNTMEVIDSRDIIERIQELQDRFQLKQALEKDNAIVENRGDIEYSVKDWAEVDEDGDELIALLSLQEQCENYVDSWEYGVTLIHEDYFEDYMDEMIEDCYNLPKNLPFWMKVTYDYDALKMDYTEVDFDGVTYFIR